MQLARCYDLVVGVLTSSIEIDSNANYLTHGAPCFLICLMGSSRLASTAARERERIYIIYITCCPYTLMMGNWRADKAHVTHHQIFAAYTYRKWWWLVDFHTLTHHHHSNLWTWLYDGIHWGRYTRLFWLFYMCSKRTLSSHSTPTSGIKPRGVTLFVFWATWERKHVQNTFD